MSERVSNHTESLPPSAQLVQMAMGHWVSRIVYVAAWLGLADHLADGPKTADELAGTTHTHAPSLYRLMRTLASLGLLTESDGRRSAGRSNQEHLVRHVPLCLRSQVIGGHVVSGSCSIRSKLERAALRSRSARRSSTGWRRIPISRRSSARL